MKILFITYNINQVGGIERVLNILSNYLSDNFKFKVEILSLYSKENNLFFNIKETVKIKHGCLDTNSNKFKLVKCLRDLLEKNDADIIITTHGFISNAVLINKKYLKNKNIIVTEHVDYYDSSKKRRIIRAILYKRANKVIVLTNKSKELYERYLNNVEVIANPLSFSTDKTSNQKNKKIIAVGRLEEVKRFNLLIEIFKNISNLHKEWILDIVGDGSQKEYLQYLINKNNLEERVKIKPFTKNIMNEYLNASIYALTSEFEGFSLVLTEAKECGLPCISFDIDSAKEIIEDNNDGILVKNNDVKLYSKALSELIDDKKLRRKMSDNAKQNVEIYRIDNIAERWKKLFEELLYNK